MKYVLLADSGSTNTSWCAINEKAEVLAQVRTQGLNPFFISTNEIIRILTNELTPDIRSIRYDEVHFYGAGCTAE